MKRSTLIGALVVSLAMSSAAMAGPGGRGHDHHRESYRTFHDGRHDFRPGTHQRAYRGSVRYGTYRRPHGYYARRWVRGERLPVGYYARPYLISDYYTWGLRVPPRGYHWVRVDGDAVLAAVATGIVLDTVFHVFN
jgi:Ni/Co efflux regulator RcnB